MTVGRLTNTRICETLLRKVGNVIGDTIKLTMDIRDSDDVELYASKDDLCVIIDCYEGDPVVQPIGKELSFVLAPDEYILHTDLEVT